MLHLTCAGTALFGLLLLIALISPLYAVLNFFADLIHWPLDQQQKINSMTEQTLIAILGGVMIGIACFVWQITDHVYKQNPTRGARMITLSLLAWYVPDGLGSLATGAWFNVVLNSVFLGLFLAPVLLAHRPETVRPT